ncbi:MAG: M15 family metallopeptidase [Cyanobacteriota bacterium]
MRKINWFIILLLLLLTINFNPTTWSEEMPEDFCYLEKAIPGIIIDLRYKSSNNFLGRPVKGYENARCVLSKKAAKALESVQEDLQQMGLGIKIFDAYRPQRSVDDFVEWAKDINDTKTKKNYYPDVLKNNLFKDGYIAARSSHSRGSTVDLTIVGFDKNGKAIDLDMGSMFDFFGQKSHPDYQAIPYQAKANRLLLRTLMIKNGFTPLAEEWWHFTYKEEPYPDTYFDFTTK